MRYTNYTNSWKTHIFFFVEEKISHVCWIMDVLRMNKDFIIDFKIKAVEFLIKKKV